MKRGTPSIPRLSAPRLSIPRLVLLYAGLGTVYLLYLPHALPVLDDWTYLELFGRARAGGLAAVFDLLARLLDNRLLGQYRIFWAGFVPVWILSLAAGFHAWPYFLLAWIAHLLTAVLLARIVSLLAGDGFTAFLAGALYMVLPFSNGALFWSLATSFYWVQTLALLGWFYVTWKKLSAGDTHYRAADLALLLPVAFSGEQILLALVLLLPLTFWLFGDRPHHRALARFWLIHAAVLAALLSLYILVINKAPIFAGLHNRYQPAARWSPWPIAARLLASLGFHPALAEWRPAWRLDPVWLALLALAGAVLFRGARASNRDRSGGGSRLALLLWSLAATALTFAPVALLPGIEWRYLYVPAPFLAVAGASALCLLRRRAAVALAFVALLYCISLDFFELRQCWLPQSREAQAALDAVSANGPFRAGDVVLFAHAPYSFGTAPSFILGASWSLDGMLAHVTGLTRIQGGRELLVNEDGDLALYNRDTMAPFSRDEIPRLRIFVHEAAARFAPKSILAIPSLSDSFQLLTVGEANVTVPVAPLTLDQLRTLPMSNAIYFAHPFKGPLPRP